MQIFSLGMHDELKMEPSVINKVFPSLEELVKVAVQFNEALQSKQRDGHPVETIGDVLVNQVRDRDLLVGPSHYQGLNFTKLLSRISLLSKR